MIKSLLFIGYRANQRLGVHSRAMSNFRSLGQIAGWKIHSVRGKGLKVLYPIQLDACHDYRWWFEKYSRYLSDRYGVIVDKSCKDICRLAFLCHDASVYYNPSAMLSFGYDSGTMELGQGSHVISRDEERVKGLCRAVEQAGVCVWSQGQYIVCRKVVS